MTSPSSRKALPAEVNLSQISATLRVSNLNSFQLWRYAYFSGPKSDIVQVPNVPTGLQLAASLPEDFRKEVNRLLDYHIRYFLQLLEGQPNHKSDVRLVREIPAFLVDSSGSQLALWHIVRLQVSFPVDSEVARAASMLADCISHLPLAPPHSKFLPPQM